MADQQDSNLFRKEALEQLSSPEQLDQLIQVVNLKDWIPLASIGFLVSIILFWSIFARIPTVVKARGLLLKSTDANPMINVSYFSIADGRQIQPGDALLIIPDSVNFQDSGGLEARVTAVSSTPVTQEDLLNRINGNQELAKLVYTPASIEVTSALQPDSATATGYRWSIGQGPQTPLMPETPTTARVVVKEQAPISFVFPFLRR